MVEILDFTSALYLGMYHPRSQLPDWQNLTNGKPSALYDSFLFRHLGHQLAQMQGMETGFLMPSTLHLFWDLFDQWKNLPIVVFRDAGSYPVSAWGVNRECAKVVDFAHGHVGQLKRMIKQHLIKGEIPVVLTNGWCPKCGKALPIRAYQQLMRALNGVLLIDDSQSLGILGSRPNNMNPYGFGGGGILQWLGLDGQHTILGSSLAKGFGVPLSILSGSQTWIKQLKRESRTRVHCSPPDQATIAAADVALQRNRKEGTHLRKRLYQNVRHFRSHLLQSGLKLNGGFFPVQSISGIHGDKARDWSEQLQKEGVQNVLTANHYGEATITFIIRADHDTKNIRKVSQILGKMIKKTKTHY